MPESMWEYLPERMSDRIDRMLEYIPNVYFHMVCQKLCQNNVSGWGSLEENNDYCWHGIETIWPLCWSIDKALKSSMDVRPMFNPKPVGLRFVLSPCWSLLIKLGMKPMKQNKTLSIFGRFRQFPASPLGRSPYYRLPRNSAEASRSARTPARHRRGVGFESVSSSVWSLGDSANTKGIYIMGI